MTPINSDGRQKQGQSGKAPQQNQRESLRRHGFGNNLGHGLRMVNGLTARRSVDCLSDLGQQYRGGQRCANHDPRPRINRSHPSVLHLVNRNVGLISHERAGETHLPMLDVAHDADNLIVAHLGKRYGPTDGGPYPENKFAPVRCQSRRPMVS